MKILVTGSSGRIGRAVVEVLLERDYQVVGFDVQPSAISHARFTSITRDFSDTSALAQACDRRGRRFTPWGLDELEK